MTPAASPTVLPTMVPTVSVLSPSTPFPIYSIGIIVAVTVVAIVLAACVVKAKRALNRAVPTNNTTPTANLTTHAMEMSYEQPVLLNSNYVTSSVTADSPQIASENHACPVDTYETVDTHVGYQLFNSQAQYEQTSPNDGHPMGLDDGCAEHETPSTDVMRLRGSTQPATYYSIPNGGETVYSIPLDTPNLDSEGYVAHTSQDEPNYVQVESSHARADTDAVYQVPTISLTSTNDGYDTMPSSS